MTGTLNYQILILISVGLSLTACSLDDKGSLFSFQQNKQNQSVRQGPTSSCSSLDPGLFSKTVTLQNQKWTELLTKYVRLSGEVDYKSWSQDAQDVEDLQLVVEIYGFENFDESRDQKLARTINLYNSATVLLIVRNLNQVLGTEDSPLPLVKSIRNIGGHDYEIWNESKLAYEDQTISLNDLEHKIIRPLGDPRIHFAINCASKGCPRLATSAFEAENIDLQLDLLTCEFVNSGHQTIFGENSIETSMILDWFWSDFEKLYSTQQEFFAVWSGSPQMKDWKIQFQDYDWTLNDL